VGGDKKLDKACAAIAEDTVLEVKTREHPWVSRGRASRWRMRSDHFAIDVTRMIALDVGASNRFTDVLLSKGAARIYAVDVGHGQLAWKLRQDPRVVVLERVNAAAPHGEGVPEDLTSSFAMRASSPRLCCRSVGAGETAGATRRADQTAIRGGPARVATVWCAIPRFPRGLRPHRGVAHRPRLEGWRDRREPDQGPEGNVEFLIHATR